MDVFSRRIIGFGVGAAHLEGPGLCRMFNRAIANQNVPKYLSADHDPLFRFHRWRANLRILEVEEIKSVPGVPRSHAFVERLIGTIRREYLDRTLFWNLGDLERKLAGYKAFYNQYRCHGGLAGMTPVARLRTRSRALIPTAGENTATGSLRPRSPPELQFATHTFHDASISGAIRQLRCVWA